MSEKCRRAHPLEATTAPLPLAPGWDWERQRRDGAFEEQDLCGLWKGVQVPQEGPQRRAGRWGSVGRQGRDLWSGLESPWGLLRLCEPTQKVTAYCVFPLGLIIFLLK